jgi:AhpD family alkylhydroperoxidase
MKAVMQGLFLAVVISTPAFGQAPAAQRRAPGPEYQAALKDIQQTLGMVPEFLRSFPDYALPGAWEEMKAIELNPNSAIPGKYKELIALGVAAQIPCTFCTYFHTQAAKLNGATEDEIKHAVATAALTRHWSTYINGIQMDEQALRADIRNLVQKARSGQGVGGAGEGTGGAGQPAMGAQQATGPITTPQEALKDIERTYGMVPMFLRAFPEQGLPGAWKQMKAIESPNAPLPPKYVSLVNLGVAAQVPCTYCVFADTEFAKLGGASDREIKEAVAVASIVRHWSTYVNGTMMDEAKFRRDADQMISILRKRAASAPQGGGR